jgi:hypothetical protein
MICRVFNYSGRKILFPQVPGVIQLLHNRVSLIAYFVYILCCHNYFCGLPHIMDLYIKSKLRTKENEQNTLSASMIFYCIITVKVLNILIIVNKLFNYESIFLNRLWRTGSFQVR